MPSLGPVFPQGNSLGLFPASQLPCATQWQRRNSEKGTSRAGKHRDSRKAMQVCAERGASATLGQGCWGHGGPWWPLVAQDWRLLCTALWTGCLLGLHPELNPHLTPHCNKGVCLPGRAHCSLGPGSSCTANTAWATSALRCLVPLLLEKTFASCLAITGAGHALPPPGNPS